MAKYIDAYRYPDDLNYLLVQCLKTPGITLLIAHAISDNRYKRLSLAETKRVLAYAPKVDGFDLLEASSKEA